MFHLTCLLGRLTSSVQRVMTSATRPIVIFVLGGPGAGKGTQCERIVKVYFCTLHARLVGNSKCILSCKRGAVIDIMRDPLVEL